MKYKLMSLGLGIALSLGILLFMATLVEPPRGEKVASEQKSIVINMQNEVTEVQVREPTDEIAWQGDGRTLVTASHSGQVRAWDMDYAMRASATKADVAEVCTAKLQGALDAGGVPLVRRLDSETTFAAPILRGREGENVCAPPPVPWWERAAGAVFGWAFR